MAGFEKVWMDGKSAVMLHQAFSECDRSCPLCDDSHPGHAEAMAHIDRLFGGSPEDVR